jgi:hypothetical protein
MIIIVRRQRLLKFQQNVQRFALKYIQKQEANKTISAHVKKRQRKISKLKGNELSSSSSTTTTNNQHHMFGSPNEISIEKNYYEIFEAIAKKEEEALNMDVTSTTTTTATIATSITDTASATAQATPTVGNSNGKLVTSIGLRKSSDVMMMNVIRKEATEMEPAVSNDIRMEAKTALQRELEEITLALDSTQDTDHFHRFPIRRQSNESLLIGKSKNDDARTMKLLHFKSKSEAYNNHHYQSKQPLLFNTISDSHPNNVSIPIISKDINPHESYIIADNGNRYDDDDDNNNSNNIMCMKQLQPLLMGQNKEMLNWFITSSKYKYVHQHLSYHMNRDNELLVDMKAFSDRLIDECCRNFELVHIDKGTIEITPMQALHLPETLTNLFVRISYGKEVWGYERSFPCTYYSVCISVCRL